MTLPMPVLYSFRRCPYAMRARLAVKAAGIRVELREVVLRDKPQALRAASPKATVPVLVLPDGAVIEQSFEIMQWALALRDPRGWCADDGPGEAAEVRALVDANDGDFKPLLDRYKYAGRHPERPAAGWRDEAVALWLAPLDARIARHGAVLRRTSSLADAALMPFVRQFAEVDRGWFDAAPLEALRRWLDDWCASDLFTAVMPKFEPWRPGAVPVVF
jgi:glutathione S-transferase